MPINLSPYDWFRMTDQSYDKKTDGHTTEGLPAGWKSLQLPNDASGWSVTIFINPKTKEIVLGHRGTEFHPGKEGRQDLFADAQIAVGVIPKQALKAEEFLQKLMKHKTFKDYTVSHTGHSLGGYIAEYLALKYQQKAVSFDAPPNTPVVNDNLLKWANNNITAYTIDTTFTNMLPRTYGTRIDINQQAAEKAGFIDSHGRDNIVQYFDSSTGQLRLECFQNKLVSTQVPTYTSSQYGQGYNNKEFITIKPLTYIKTTISDTTEEGCARAKSSSSGLLSKIQSFN